MKSEQKVPQSHERRTVLHRLWGLFVTTLAGCHTWAAGPSSESGSPYKQPAASPDKSSPSPVPSVGTPLRRFPATLTAETTAMVTRGGQVVPYSAGMPLYVGDQIWNPNSYAVIVDAYGDEVFLRQGSRIEIGSIFVSIGEIFVRIINSQGRDLFRVESDLVAAGPEGTEFLVRVFGENATEVIVRQGVVGCSPRRGGWAFMRVYPGQQFSVDRSERPTVITLPQESLRARLAWVNEAAKRLRRLPLIDSPQIIQ